MQDRAVFYAMTDEDVLDHPWRTPEGGPGAASRSLAPAIDALPEGWARGEHGPWSIVAGPAPLPDDGWKIHVGATPDRACHVAGVVARLCTAQGVTWKVLRTARLVAMTQSKYAPRECSGKVCTIYPPDEPTLALLLEELTSRLRGEPASRVLGDIGDPDAPVSVRWGAFRVAWLRGPDGAPVPATRLPDGTVAHDVRVGAAHPLTLPDCVRRLSERSARADCRRTVPVTDVSLLVRHNSGAVYSATFEGRPVVLKEARLHCGYAGDGSDAVTRLRHEHEVLQRLSGHGVAPEPLAYLACGGSEFLVTERVPGEPLGRRVSATGPTSWAPGDRAAADRYDAWSRLVLTDLEDVVRRMHDLGIVHGDLHPSNVIVTPDGTVRLVDLECASLDGRRVTQGGGSAGFTVPGAGPDRDLGALRRLGILLGTAAVVVLDRRPDLEDVVRRSAEEDRAYAVSGVLPPVRSTGPSREDLVAGVVASATPRRTDRLHPGSVAQLDTPGGGHGLWTGAAGVLLTLDAIGAPLPPEQLAWLAGTPVPTLAEHRGLAFGAEGVAYAVARLGDAGRALEVVDHAHRHGLPVVGPSWGFGHAGVAVALDAVAERSGDPTVAALAADHVERLLRIVAGPVTPPRPGLLHGLSGTALCLLRLAGSGRWDTVREELLGAARRCLHLELASCRLEGDALLGVDGRRLMPYLGVGSAAAGIVAQRLLEEGTDDERCRWAVEGVLRALRRPAMVGAGLAEGRAGILLALREIDATEPMTGVHRDRLGWYAVRPSRAPLAGSSRGCLVPGEQGLRLSADVASGAAGVLAALDTGRAARDVLLLPDPDDTVTDRTVTDGPAIAARHLTAVT